MRYSCVFFAFLYATGGNCFPLQKDKGHLCRGVLIEFETLSEEKRAKVDKLFEDKRSQGRDLSFDELEGLMEAQDRLHDEFFQKSQGNSRLLPKGLRNPRKKEHMIAPVSLTRNNIHDSLVEHYYFPREKVAFNSANNLMDKTIEFMGEGSGVILGNGYVLTAKHVIKTLNENQKIKYYDPIRTNVVTSVVKGKIEVVYADTELDFAIVKVPELNEIKPAKLADVVSKKGEVVLASGTPYTMGEQVVSVGRMLDVDNAKSIVASNEVYGGMSGGPLANEKGEVMGILSMGASSDYTRYSSYVPVERIKPILLSLKIGQ